MFTTIHKAIQPAGLVASAATYSLFRDTLGLYAIKTGPAARELKELKVRGLVAELLAKFIFSKVAARTAKKVAEGEAKIQENMVPELSKKSENLFALAQNISSCSITTNKFDYPEVSFLHSEKKYTFIFRDVLLAEVQSFFQGL